MAQVQCFFPSVMEAARPREQERTHQLKGSVNCVGASVGTMYLPSLVKNVLFLRLLRGKSSNRGCIDNFEKREATTL